MGSDGSGDEAKPYQEGLRQLPDWAKVHRELRRKGVTLRLLWQEYRQDHPEGYGRSQFCHLYRQWAGKIDPVLRQHHEPGDKLFVDWAGQKVPICRSEQKCVEHASLFIAVMGASNKTYVAAFPNEQTSSWINGHVGAFRYFGGITRALVPDNPKTAVIRPCRYEPGLNRSCMEMADHYRVVKLPARHHKHRDKAKVETGGLIGEREILVMQRDQRFFGFFNVGEVSRAIARQLAQLNDRPSQKLPGSRNSWFEAHGKELT